jgi:hypothetical protein
LIFPNYSFDIEEIEGELNFLIERLDKSGNRFEDGVFRLENSASGYAEVIYM